MTTRDDPSILRMVLPLTPSGNQTNKMHHMALHRWRQEMTVMARTKCREKCTHPEKRQVSIVRHSRGEIDVHDNLPWGCKQIVDALVCARVLWDDSPKYVQVSYAQFSVKKKKEQKTVVVVYKWPCEYPNDPLSWKSDITLAQSAEARLAFVDHVKRKAGISDEQLKTLARIVNGEMGET